MVGVGVGLPDLHSGEDRLGQGLQGLSGGGILLVEDIDGAVSLSYHGRLVIILGHAWWLGRMRIVDVGEDICP